MFVPDEETAMGYIPNAKLIPMDTIPDNLNAFNKKRHTILYVLVEFEALKL